MVGISLIILVWAGVILEVGVRVRVTSVTLEEEGSGRVTGITLEEGGREVTIFIQEKRVGKDIFFDNKSSGGLHVSCFGFVPS